MNTAVATVPVLRRNFAAGSDHGGPRAITREEAQPQARPSMGEGLDRSTVRRMRAFHAFGTVLPLASIPLVFALGGDVFARQLFCVGVCLLALTNVCQLWLSASPDALGSPIAAALWVLGGVGMVPAIYYFGPFSAVVMIQLLSVVFIAIGRERTTAIAVIAFTVVAHLALATPMIAGWIDDVGLLSSNYATRSQLAISEALIVGFMISGFALGRWARDTSIDVLAELAAARRAIGDHQQALAEVNADVARANLINEGRWTGQTLGTWRIGLVVGRGAMGEVYEAVGTEGRLAAIKLLAPRAEVLAELVERFHREMAVAVRLESPHIVRVFEVSPPDARVPYLAMERLDGVDLAMRLRSGNRMSVDEVLAMVDQVSRGLEVAHRAGVVHRDLKPHNLFCHQGRWKVLDFGVAKVLGSEGTLTGDAIVGTPQYMAPEQASGKDVSHLADVYALGAIAYRCLTGRAPFAGNDLAALVYQVVHAAPVRPATLGAPPGPIEDTLAIAMAKDPTRRFPSALRFVEELAAARDGRAPSLPPPPKPWS